MMTDNEKQIIRMIAKDIATSYNARSLSPKIGITPRGTLKALKKLEEMGIVRSKPIGKALIYNLIWTEYTKKIVSIALFEEAHAKGARWVAEFDKLTEARALILFGSVLQSKNYNDVDIVIVTDEKHIKNIEQKIAKKNEILLKPIHPIWQTPQDIKKNLKRQNPVMLNALKSGLIIKGQDNIVEVLAHVASGE